MSRAEKLLQAAYEALQELASLPSKHQAKAYSLAVEVNRMKKAIECEKENEKGPAGAA